MTDEEYDLYLYRLAVSDMVPVGADKDLIVLYTQLTPRPNTGMVNIHPNNQAAWDRYFDRVSSLREKWYSDNADIIVEIEDYE